MKIIHQKITYIITVFALSVFFALPGTAGAQSSLIAKLSVDPQPGSTLNRDAIIPFTVTVDSDEEPINVVSFTMEYNQSQLEFVGFDGSDSAFDFAAPTEPSGNGVVFVTRGTPTQGGLTQQQKVGVVNFRVLGDSGSTTLRFGEDSNVIRVGAVDIWDRNTTIGTYNLLPSTGDDPTIIPVSQTFNDDKLVAIKVTDASNQPLPNKKVTVGNRTTTTDNSGTASFGGLPSGSYQVEVEDEDGVIITESEIVVSDDIGNSEVQSFELRVEEDSSPVGLLLTISGIIIIVALLIIFIKKTGIMNRANSNTIDDPYYDIDALSQRQNLANSTNSFTDSSQQQGPPEPGQEINPQQ